VDLLYLGDWPSWRAGLRTWTAAPSARRGCVALHSPTLVSQRVWQPDEEAPVVCVLENLMAAGWRRGLGVREHAAGTPRLFHAPDPVASRHYLRCLERLDRLLAAGSLTSLPAGQSGKYYQCVLRAADPGAVPRGQAPAVYAAMLQDAPPPGPHAADAAPAIADDDAPVSELAAAAPTTAGRPTGKRPATHRLQPLGEALWQGLEDQEAPTRKRGRSQADARPQGPEAMDVQPRQPPTRQAGPAASSRTPALAHEVSAGREARQPRPVVLQLEGLAVYFEEHGAQGEGSHYKRVCVRCPHAQGAHRQAGQPLCGKKRGIGHAQTRAHGEREPYAFLGAWLQAASRMPDRTAHMAHTPTQAEVRAYMRAQGWLAGAQAATAPQTTEETPAPDG
jgi:hypothetical protein